MSTEITNAENCCQRSAALLGLVPMGATKEMR